MHQLVMSILVRKVGLSGPAVHERVKKLKRLGMLKGISASLDPRRIGKEMLAFVHVDTRGWRKSPELMAIGELPEVEEIHSVAGDTCLMLKVRTRNSSDLESLLAVLYDMPGVISTRSYVVLSTYLERPVQANMTEQWPET